MFSVQIRIVFQALLFDRIFTGVSIENNIAWTVAVAILLFEKWLEYSGSCSEYFAVSIMV